MPDFTESGLSSELLRAITELGFEQPTPIQQETIPTILQSKTDIIALAQTGTGKTAAFGLPTIEQIETDRRDTQALILCPTRELCNQIALDLQGYAKYLPAVNIVAVFGGARITSQIKDVKAGAHLIVGTPGRILDLIRRKVVKIQNIQRLVLDEADEMLNMGFKEELDAILSETPQEKQTLLFSATMPKGIARIADDYMSDPIEIAIGNKNAGADTVSHEYFIVHAKDRYRALKRIVDASPQVYGIIFCRTREETKEVADKLQADGYNVDALHGDLSQVQREQVMLRFRNQQLQMIVCTDVAARGLDVSNLSHVINYKLPDDPEVYIHRSGRTGRAGKTGIAISIIHTREYNRIQSIERIAKSKFEHKELPTGKEVCEKQLMALIDKVTEVEIDDNQIHDYLEKSYARLEHLNREELIQRFISIEFNRFLSYYKDAPDLSVKHHKEKNRDFSNGRIGFSRMFINLGSKNGISPRVIISLINEYTRSKNIEIGKIEVMKKFSFFETDSRYQQEILHSFRNAKYSGKKIVLELASEKGSFFDKRSKRSKRSR